jgi:hypothetical protein
MKSCVPWNMSTFTCTYCLHKALLSIICTSLWGCVNYVFSELLELARSLVNRHNFLRNPWYLSTKLHTVRSTFTPCTVTSKLLKFGLWSGHAGFLGEWSGTGIILLRALQSLPVDSNSTNCCTFTKHSIPSCQSPYSVIKKNPRRQLI